jgi:hypothetical protein
MRALSTSSLLLEKRNQFLALPDVRCQMAGTVPESTSLFRQKQKVFPQLSCIFLSNWTLLYFIRIYFCSGLYGENRGLLMKRQGITERKSGNATNSPRKVLYFVSTYFPTSTFQKCLLSSDFKKIIFVFLNYNRKINKESQPTLESNLLNKINIE